MAVAMLCSVLVNAGAIAGEIRLSDGTVLRGTIRAQQSLALASQRSAGELTTYPIIAAVTPLRRYYVPTRHVAELNNDSDLDRFQTFELSRRKARFSTQLLSLGIPAEVGPWDDFGRRRVIFRVKDRPLNIYQWVTKLTPHHASVVAQGIGWSHGISTNAIPPDVLDRWLRRLTDADRLDDRLAIARFYLQADMFKQARRELTAVKAKFPKQATRIDSLQARLDELVGQKILDELKRRRDNGQHKLFRTALASFPLDQLSAVIRRQVRELIEQDRTLRDQLASAKQLLAEALAEITETKTREQLEPLVDEIVAGVDVESISRLDAFLKLSDDATLEPSEKLALAGSGWLSGSANAVTVVSDTVSLFRARDLLLEAARADLADLPGLLSQLESLEGISAVRIATLIGRLPAILPSPEIRPGTTTRVESTAARCRQLARKKHPLVGRDSEEAQAGQAERLHRGGSRAARSRPSRPGVPSTGPGTGHRPADRAPAAPGRPLGRDRCPTTVSNRLGSHLPRRARTGSRCRVRNRHEPPGMVRGRRADRGADDRVLHLLLE